MKKFFLLFCIFFTISAFGASKPEIFVQTGHSGYVTYVALNKSETHLVTIAEGSSLGVDMKIWDIASAKELKTLNIGFYSVQNIYFLDDNRFMVLTYGRAAVYDIHGELLEKFDLPKSAPTLNKISRNRDFAFRDYGGDTVTVFSLKDGSEVVIPEITEHRDKYYSIHLTDLGFSHYGVFYRTSFNEADKGGYYTVYNDSLEPVFKGRILDNFSIFDKYVKISPDLKYIAYSDKSGSNDIFVADLKTGLTTAVIRPRELRFIEKDPLTGFMRYENVSFSFLPDGRLLLEYNLPKKDISSADTELSFITLHKNGIYSTKSIMLKDYHKFHFQDNHPYEFGSKQTMYAGYKNGNVKSLSIETGAVVKSFGVVPLNFTFSTVFQDKLINSDEWTEYSMKTQNMRYNLWDLKNLRLDKYNITASDTIHKGKIRIKDYYMDAYFLDNPIKYYSAMPGYFFKEKYWESEDFGRTSAFAFFYFNSIAPFSVTRAAHNLVISDSATKQERAKLYAFEDGEWVIITPDGYYTASENGEKYINVRIDKNVYTLGNYRETFFRPDLVRLSIDGNPLSGTKNIAEAALPPSVQIINTPASTDRQSVDITLKITDNGGGIGSVRLFVNGTGVMTDSARSIKKQGSAAETIKTYTIKIPSGESVVKAAAFDSEDAVQSNFAEIRIVSAYAQSKKPSLYVLAVGIDSYRNPKLNLKYAAADADLFAQSIKASSQALFAKTDVQVLNTPEKTSKDAVIKALESFKSMNPDDVFVFFVASHGTVDDGEYFLITSNVGALSTERLKSDALTQAQLKESIANIPSTKKLILIDTCSSGKLGEELSAAMMTRGMSEDTAIKILSRAVGSTIISASTSQQEALEGYRGHGLFTYVFAEGLKGKADSDKDGFVKTSELANYIEETVPDIAQKFFNRSQFPTVNSAGQSFPVGRN